MSQTIALSPQTPASPPAAATSSPRFSVDDIGFFEGTEKLLEIWFGFQSSNHNGLREIQRSFWVELLTIAKCHILSECTNGIIDAYLLSESSMYITKNRFILKTCGTTSMLECIQPLLERVKKLFPLSEVKDVFFSHSKFMKPDLQLYPHHSFIDESSFLDTIFTDGGAYVMGRLNGRCWYLYLVECVDRPMQLPDQTLEVLMTDMNPELIGKFSKIAYSNADDLTKSVGIADLCPGAILDAYIFDPCGYSLNAIVKEDTYFTVHVTPQEECSYVSFETNLIERSYNDLLVKLLEIFKPGRFTITLFANKVAKCGLSYSAVEDITIEGYTCQEKQISLFNFYNLTFVEYKHC